MSNIRQRAAAAYLDISSPTKTELDSTHLDILMLLKKTKLVYDLNNETGTYQIYVINQ